MSTKKAAHKTTSLELNHNELKILRSFHRQIKTRYVTVVLLVLGLLYCVSMSTVSVYYAIEMFRGAREEKLPHVTMPSVKIPLSTTSPSSDPDSAAADSDNTSPTPFQPVEQTLEPVKAFYDKINFTGVGWTSMLHAALLFFLAVRAIVRLRELRKQTPRARLAIKFASRLSELGELNKKTTADK